MDEQRPVGGIEDIRPEAAVGAEGVIPPTVAGAGSGPALSPVPARRASVRWAIALFVAALVVAVAGGAFFILAGSSESFATAAWAPADSVAYGAVRLDLPGDQRQNMASFLSVFPGFADQSTFDQKFDESLDRLVKSASKGSSDYSTTLKPWLGGELGFVVTRVPKIPTGASLAPAASPGPALRELADTGGGLVLLTVKDRSGAETWFRKVVGQATSTTETYAGATINLYQVAEKTGAGVPETVAETVSGGVMLIGDETSVKAGLDAKAKGGLDATAGYRAARSAVAGDRLGWLYLDLKGYLQGVLAAMPASAAPSIDAAILAKLPVWMAAGLRAESGALVGDAAAPAVAGSPSGTNQVSALAPLLPGSTVVALEARSIGSSVKSVFDQLRSQPAEKATVAQIDDALSRVGGFDSLIGWMGDGAVAVTSSGSTWSGGVVVKAADASTAEAKLTQLKNLLALAGLGGSGIATRDESYAGTTITVTDLGDLGNLASALDPSATTALPISGHLELAFAHRNGLIVLGIGDGFVKAVLDTKAGSSLADQSHYRAVIERAGNANTGQLYIDVAGLVNGVESALPADARARYEADYKPYVQHLEAIAEVGSAGDPSRLRFVLTVK